MIFFKRVLARINRVLNPPKNIEEEFHAKYYYSKVWSETYFLGKKVFKCPNDLWLYQEMLWELRPDVIIECGTFHGGSALYYAKLFDMMDLDGEIITIDVDPMPDMPVHRRITYLVGSSTSSEIVGKVKELIEDKKKIMVILDSDHSKEHVLKELELYHGFVTPGSYLVVEDSNINGHPVYSGFGQGPGPWEAMEAFLPGHPEFVPDKTKEKFLMSFNPNGYLKRIK
ncbi:Rhamnosyl O-methyltransferase [Candidatus Brocadiaceae bacterium]|nr:Rhamnosyl O-methyltransferase [Candidatus Brocadiaceae bacterium]